MPHTTTIEDPLTDRVVLDPNILLGKPVIRGTRIAVEFVLELLGEGWPEMEIIKSYPGLTREDVQACCRYAGSLVREERVFPRVGE